MKFNHKSLHKLILIIAALVSVASVIYFSTAGTSLLYRDAKSHLNIARRVIFSQTPGMVQLGGTWLPLLHVLMLPTIWVDQFYYSGLAGIIPSMLSFILLAIVISKVVYLYSKDKLASGLASLVILINPSLLYLQSTPMSELLLLATSTTSIYFLIRWAVRRKYTDAVFSAIFIFLATLTRYDAWFLFACEIAIMLLIGLFSSKASRKIEGHFFLFAFLGGLGILLWGLYNKLIFGNILNFALGQGSGSWDAQRVSSTSNLSTKFNLLFSFSTYFWMVVDNVGPIILLGAFIGLAAFLYNKKGKKLLLPGLLLLAPFVFNILSLFLGQSVAFSKHLPPFEHYNLRYGSVTIPAAAFFLGIVATKGRIGKFLVAALLSWQAFLFYTHPLEILVDADVGNIESEIKIAHWIKNHPTEGQTLLSALAHDPLLFEAKIPMEKLVYEGNQRLWTGALQYPEGYVDRVVLKVSDTTNDAVRKELYNTKVLKEKFIKSYDDGDYQVYDKKASSL